MLTYPAYIHFEGKGFFFFLGGGGGQGINSGIVFANFKHGAKNYAKKTPYQENTAVLNIQD
jgi:hypothetical protein